VVVAWIRRHDALGGISALAVYLVVVGAAWLLVSMQLPRLGNDGRRIAGRIRAKR
jgi:hypothetical protein